MSAPRPHRRDLAGVGHGAPLPPAPPAAAVEPAGRAPLSEPPPGFHPLAPYRGLVRRFFAVHRHLLGLLAGGVVAYVRGLPPERRRGLRSAGVRILARTARPFLDPEVARLPFPAQLRRRLELLGPTYVKLGQIMAVREDLLPGAVCAELRSLFERVPPFPFEQFRARIEESLGRPIELDFASIDPRPIGSASIAQVHRARTLAGEQVVVKVMRPGIRSVIEADLRLLRILAGGLQWVLARYQPRRIVREFAAYTIKEIDFTSEADNAETFAANFRDMPEVVFPRVYRELSSDTVLTMEFLDGFRPGSPATARLDAEERARVVDLGAASIIRMLYQDGFFHADLHAGNLLILPGAEGAPTRIGFIDLGMVGRFEERTRRRMLYYYHALVTGDVEGAARFLADMATVGPRGDPQGFARAVEDLSRRFIMRAARGRFSIAQLILESMGLGGRYRVFFPVEMTLMVKALVTFEGVGRMMDPELNVAAISRPHVSRVFRAHFSPVNLLRGALRGTPELVDLAERLPELLTTGARFLEETMSRRPAPAPLAGLRGSILSAACVVGGVVALVSEGPVLLWVGLFALAAVLALWSR